MGASKLTPEERLRRKRYAARLRQQRCRARKRMQVLKARQEKSLNTRKKGQAPSPGKDSTNILYSPQVSSYSDKSSVVSDLSRNNSFTETPGDTLTIFPSPSWTSGPLPGEFGSPRGVTEPLQESAVGTKLQTKSPIERTAIDAMLSLGHDGSAQQSEANPVLQRANGLEYRENHVAFLSIATEGRITKQHLFPFAHIHYGNNNLGIPPLGGSAEDDNFGRTDVALKFQPSSSNFYLILHP